MEAVDDLDRIFATDGPLAGTVTHYAPRPEQLQMAKAVASAMASLDSLVVEAGTGTGKTFAYLVPALISGRRVAISTGTRALQDQLFLRDLPTLAAAIGVPVRVAMLKGRANYLCRYRLAQATPFDRTQAAHLAIIERWSHETSVGDIGEVEDVPEDSPIWPRVTSTADNCLGARCPEYARCCVAVARRRAGEAELVVINHHLLLADLALRDGGFGELLPSVDVVVVDEAHQVPEIAAQQFGRSLAQGQVISWLRDLETELVSVQLDDDLAEPMRDLEQTALHVRRLLGGGARRIAWAEVPGAVGDALDELGNGLEHVGEVLGAWSDVSSGLETARRRALDLSAFVADFLAPDTIEELRWVDVHRHSYTLHRTPIESAETLGAALRGRPCSWIFTSATLAVEQDFQHFMTRVGLEAAATLKLDSPFDYDRNALLYLPAGMPAPSQPGYVEAACERVLPLIEANAGGTFLLFTSYRSLGLARDWLDGRTDRLILVQGDASRTSLLARFRADGRAILLGTSSFWEGVDVRGPALSLVMIDKLPFASPFEPLLRARLDWLESQGRSGFREHQLPAAVIALKQGVGRLIRDHDDSGVLMICDPRLQQRGYGKRFLRSLPPMQRTDDPVCAAAFLQRVHRAADTGPAASAPTGTAGAAGAVGTTSEEGPACVTPASDGSAP
jgi:ATP-dependent DNA helicase DinG